MNPFLLLLLSLLSTPAHAQCNGVFGSASLCGSNTGGPPQQIPLSTLVPGTYTVPGIVTGSSAAATANSTAINAVIQTAGAAGGGTVNLPCGQIFVGATIDNNVNNVLVKGAGGASSGTTSFCTEILPSFSGVVLKHRTPYGTGATAQNYGGGFANLTVNGNGNSTANLIIDSVSGGTYDIASVDAADAATGNGHANVLIESCVTGTNLANCNVQLIHLLKLNVSQTATAVDAVQFLASTNANFSGNDNTYISVTHKNGLALNCQGADNNVLYFGSFRTTGGTGNAILAGGNTATGGGCYGNVFTRVGASFADGVAPTVYASGTSDGGITSGVNNVILNLDKSNATADPTAGTGSSWTYFLTLSAGAPQLCAGCGGGGQSGFAPFIFSNKGQEQLELFPGVTSGVVRQLSFNRASSSYLTALYDAIKFNWNLSGTPSMSMSTVGTLNLGTSGTSGAVVMGNASSGTVTLTPVNGALGTVTATFPANTGTVAELNLGQTWTGTVTQTFSASSSGSQLIPIQLTNTSTGANTAVGIGLQAQGSGVANDNYSIRVLNDVLDFAIPGNIDLLQIDRTGLVTLESNGLTALSGAVTVERLKGNSGNQPVANSCAGFTLATGSGDLGGKVTFNSALTCAISFGTAFTNPPYCTAAPATAASTTIVSASTTIMSVTFGTSQTAMTYHCLGS